MQKLNKSMQLTSKGYAQVGNKKQNIKHLWAARRQRLNMSGPS